jgi:hypothetical protein
MKPVTPLDPRHIEPPASLNRVVVADVPGITIEPDVRGKTGYRLVSAKALANLIRDSAAALELDPALDDDALNRAFDVCLDDSADPAVSQAAHAIARQIGRNLGYLLLTLRRGDPVNRVARPEWDDSYWEHWSGIRRIWLGGGIVSGRLGPLMCEHAIRVFAEACYSDMQIRLSPYGSALPLVGMARKVPADHTMALIFDCGGTAVKRALALFKDGTLCQLLRFPALATYWDVGPVDSEKHIARAWWLLDQVVDIIDQTHDLARNYASDTGYTLPPTLPVRASLAAYMRDGQPLAAQHGAFIFWIHITDNAQALIAERLAERWGSRVSVTLEHDGTAAALAHAGDRDTARATAVITIGTAMGIGFPPDQSAARPVAAEFEIKGV